MYGQEMLIEARNKGRKPAFVFINDYPCITDWFEHGGVPTVCVHGDDPKDIDLWFVQGSTVTISSEVEYRAKELFDIAIDAGAAVVIAGHTVKTPHKTNSWTGYHHG